MNRLDKKQIFIGTILGIILSILTLILLTRNIQPLSAQQTQQKYTVFKTENQGFKFVKKDIVGYKYKWVEDPSRSKSYITGPFYQLPCDRKWDTAECGDIVPMPSPIASDANVAYDIDGGCNWQKTCWINYRGYVYRSSSGRQPSGYYRDISLDFGVDYNSDKLGFWYPGKALNAKELAVCDDKWNDFECLSKTPYTDKGEGYDVKIYKVGNRIILEAKYVKVTSSPIFSDVPAPIFAQTPTTTSPGNQVVTKEYVDNNLVTKEYVDNNFVKRPPLYTGDIFSKYQTTEVWTDHFIKVNPFIRTYYARIEFLGQGPGGEDGKNCALGPLYFDCVSYITLLTPFEANTLFSLYPYKSISFRVTLRGRTGAFVVDFCKNFERNGAPDDKLYWRVSENYDAGGWNPGSNYALRVFAVDRASGPGTAFIQVHGPSANIISCPNYPYSAVY